MPTFGHKTTREFATLAARRVWSIEAKRQIIAEMAVDGANVSEIARRHGVAQSLLYRWRQDLGVDAAATADRPPAHFIPVAIARAPSSSVPKTKPAASKIMTKSASIDIVLANGRSVRVGADVDTAALMRIVTALEKAG